jgi:alkanesulfonate monooxygenase SsuD/methylene tetrahydromethanopterin reductase-like flavin-dependent oxidoreductase (luciferase family)
MPDGLVAAVKRRRPDVNPADLIAGDWPDLHRQLDAYLEAGLTKFVIRPAHLANIDDFIDRLVAELIPRQN